MITSIKMKHVLLNQNFQQEDGDMFIPNDGKIIDYFPYVKKFDDFTDII